MSRVCRVSCRVCVVCRVFAEQRCRYAQRSGILRCGWPASGLISGQQNHIYGDWHRLQARDAHLPVSYPQPPQPSPTADETLRLTLDSPAPGPFWMIRTEPVVAMFRVQFHVGMLPTVQRGRFKVAVFTRAELDDAYLDKRYLPSHDIRHDATHINSSRPQIQQRLQARAHSRGAA